MPGPANIMFILNSLTVGGAEKLAVTLLNEIHTSRFSLSLTYLRKKEGLLGELEQNRLKSVSCYGGTNAVSSGLPFYLARNIERDKIDAVVCINQRPMLYAFLARKLVRRKFRIIQAVHVSTPVTRYQRLKNFVLYRPLFNRCDLVIFVSEAQRKSWLSGGLMKPVKSICIHNGIDVDHYLDLYSRESKIEFRRKLGFDETAYVVGTCGRLHLAKRHTDLIAAIGRLRSAGLDAKGIIIGDGPERSGLEACIRFMALEKDVIITGFQKDIRSFMSICDCIALTSGAEAFPLSIIEAMAMGRPVVSSEVGGTPEQIQHGVNGFLYKSGDIRNLAKYLEILADPVLRATMGEMARQVACDRFSLERMIGEYTRILSETVTTDAGLPQ